MFLEIAIGAIGIGIVLMIGYLVVAQVKQALVNTGITDTNVTEGMQNAQNTIFTGFGLVAVGIIVLAGFGLINIFK